MSTLTNEARIILEAAALALEINYPDIAAVREMLKQADALLEQMRPPTETRATMGLDPLSAGPAKHSKEMTPSRRDWASRGFMRASAQRARP